MAANLGRLKACKKDGAGLEDCPLNDPYKTCSNCRYKKCLSIGMMPARVEGLAGKDYGKSHAKNRKTLGSSSTGK